MKIDYVDKKLAISASIDDYDSLCGEITMVVNLRSEQHDDIYELTKRGISYFWIPIADWGAPRADQIELFLSLMKYSKGTVLLHCAMGKGRTVMLAIAYLLDKGLVKSIEEGEEWIKNINHFPDMWVTQRDKLKKHFNL